MLVIGERINGMFKDVRKAIQTKDKAIVQDLAKRQLASGANVLDVNVGPASADPVSAMKWLVETIYEAVDAPLAIDSPKPPVVEAGVKACKRPPIINSTDGSPDKMAALIPLAAEYKAGLIGLCMDEKGIPSTVDARLEVGMKILAACVEAGIEPQNVHLDPVILPVKFSQPQFAVSFETLRQLKTLSDPSPQLVVGLSNASQGCIDRHIVNRITLVMGIAGGLNEAIMDPFDTELMHAMITAELLMNKQIYCDSYIDAYMKSMGAGK
ncbi:MAG: dihydropteroate synthase [Planctomycetota bacterium]|nr:dihydropteroate synthase [Planctomycetota bacterium]